MDRMKARMCHKVWRHLQATRNLALLAAALALFACSTQNPRSPTANAPSAAAPSTTRTFTRGAEVAAELTAQYQDKRADCGTNNSPAFLCSGVLFRGTQASTAYHSWNPSPGSQQRGGVSFSYLRADSKFSRLAYGYTNGLIFRPYQLAGTGKLSPEVLCVFPVDSWTDGRLDKGCGAHNQFPTVSGPCQAQGISTAQQWVAHFNLASGNKNTHQCGFDVRDNGNGQAAYFTTDLAARALIPAESFGQNDELVLATWAQMENPTPLPIQAFFYLPGGLAGAQHDQKDYYDRSKAIMPIIAMTLPATAANDATFVYREQDQVVGGTEPSTEDFESFAIGTTISTIKLENMTVGGFAGDGPLPSIVAHTEAPSIQGNCIALSAAARNPLVTFTFPEYDRAPRSIKVGVAGSGEVKIQLFFDGSGVIAAGTPENGFVTYTAPTGKKIQVVVIDRGLGTAESYVDNFTASP